MGGILGTGGNGPELGSIPGRGRSVQMSRAWGDSLQEGVKAPGPPRWNRSSPSRLKPSVGHSPRSPRHQAQPLDTVWPLAGPSLLPRGQCHPGSQKTGDPSRLASSSITGWGRMRGWSVGSTRFLSCPSSPSPLPLLFFHPCQRDRLWNQRLTLLHLPVPGPFPGAPRMWKSLQGA